MDYGNKETDMKSKQTPSRRHQEKALKHLDETRCYLEDVMYDDIHKLINIFDGGIFTHIFYGKLNDERLEEFLKKNAILLKEEI